jgi:hypothetical protein
MEAHSISNNWERFEFESKEKVIMVENEMKNVSEKYKHEIEISKENVKSVIDLMRECKDETIKQTQTIQSSMTNIAVEVVKAVKTELMAKIDSIESETKINSQNVTNLAMVVDHNAKLLADRIAPLENWITEIMTKGNMPNVFQPNKNAPKFFASNNSLNSVFNSNSNHASN